MKQDDGRAIRGARFGVAYVEKAGVDLLQSRKRSVRACFDKACRFVSASFGTASAGGDQTGGGSRGSGVQQPTAIQFDMVRHVQTPSTWPL
jgi:hypothetical protein